MSPVGGGRDKRDRDEGEPQDVLAEPSKLNLDDVEWIDGGHFRWRGKTWQSALVRTPETLDVERLAWALTNTAQTRIGAPASKPDWIDRETARIIAAEYARLAASPAPDPGAGLAEAIAAALWEAAPPKIEGGSPARQQWLGDIVAVQSGFHAVGGMAEFVAAMNGDTAPSAEPPETT